MDRSAIEMVAEAINTFRNENKLGAYISVSPELYARLYNEMRRTCSVCDTSGRAVDDTGSRLVVCGVEVRPHV